MKSLKAKSLAALVLLAALNAAAAAILIRSASAQHADSIQINLSGAQRMLSQKMTKEALLLQRGGDPTALKASIARFDRVLNGLASGDAELELPGTNDPEILDGLAAARRTWQPIKTALDQCLANPAKSESALTPVIAGNMTLLAQMDQVVKLFEKRALDKLSANLRLQSGITVILIGLLFASWLIARNTVIRPLLETVEHVSIVATGDLTRKLDANLQTREDEIGSLARAIVGMSVSLSNMIRDISTKTRVVLTSSNNLKQSADKMSAGSRDTSDRAHSVAAAAEEMSMNVISVAAGMEQTTTNLDHVSRATEEMTSSIGLIAGNSEKARSITNVATRQAAEVTGKILRLGKAATEIGRVTQTISEISAQTNLLALNATIEAARAGASGKGFAVVAGEIKTLAHQAASATVDIRARIDAIQLAATESVSDVAKISQVIDEVTGMVSSIASAIEQQAATTETISRNIAEATIGVKDVNIRVAESSEASRAIAGDITTVDSVASEMTSDSDLIRVSAVDLANISEQLQKTVACFQV